MALRSAITGICCSELKDTLQSSPHCKRCICASFPYFQPTLLMVSSLIHTLLKYESLQRSSLTGSNSVLPPCQPLIESDPRSVLIMDNCRIHEKSDVQKACDEAGVWLIYFPPHLPDFNPITISFALFGELNPKAHPFIGGSWVMVQWRWWWRWSTHLNLTSAAPQVEVGLLPRGGSCFGHYYIVVVCRSQFRLKLCISALQ